MMIIMKRNDNMKIFMISGKARSGKDTFGDALESVLVSRDYKVCRLSVGTYIKFYAQRYFPQMKLLCFVAEVVNVKLNDAAVNSIRISI